jgi:UPF0271 protein
LYRAQRDEATAGAIARAVAAYDPGLVLFVQPGSVMAQVARAAGLPVAAEVFADRAYTPDGGLASRKLPGSVIHDPDAVAERALRMVTEGRITAIDGTEIAVAAETICVHGDTPGAVLLIQRIRERLGQAGVAVRPPLTAGAGI